MILEMIWTVFLHCLGFSRGLTRRPPGCLLLLQIWGGTLHAPIRDITGQCQIAKQHRHLQQQSMSSDNSMVFKALGGTEMFCDDDDDDEEHETEGLLARILSFFGLVQDEFRLDGGEDVVAETLVGQIFIYNWLAGVMLFTGFEIFTCLYLQVFYPYPDFTCKAATDSNGNPIVLVEPGGTGLLVTGLLMHFAELAASNLTQDNGFILLRCLCHFTTVFDAVKVSISWHAQLMQDQGGRWLTPRRLVAGRGSC